MGYLVVFIMTWVVALALAMAMAVATVDIYPPPSEDLLGTTNKGVMGVTDWRGAGDGANN